MTLHNTNCCAIQEIGGLRSYASPELAMHAFCLATLGIGSVKYFTNVQKDKLYSFYLFTAAVSKDGKSPSGAGTLYGENFKNLIRKARLGKVWASPVLNNDAFHPDHANQVYIWMPKIDALKKWWAAFKVKSKPKDLATWTILPALPRYSQVCRVGDYGCRKTIPIGSPARTKDGKYLCKICGEIPADQIVPAAVAVNCPPLTYGAWSYEPFPNDRGGWVCESSKKGCGSKLTPGQMVLLHREDQSRLSGHVLCESCAQPYLAKTITKVAVDIPF